MVEGRVTVDVKINKPAVNKMLRQPAGQVDKMMRGYAKDAQTAARRVSDQRVKHRTRRYRNSIDARQIQPTQVRLESDTEYSATIELGSRPHPIVARAGGVLAFKIQGKTVFARRVQHPGTRAKHVLRDGAREAGRMIRTSTE